MKIVRNKFLPVVLTLLFPFVVGAQEIVEQVYYENGNTKSITFISGDEVQVVSYYENGNIKEKALYHDMQRDGKFQAWHENGELHLDAQFDENMPEGSWEVYNNLGELVGEATFADGKLVKGSIWDDNGKIIASR